MDTNKINIGNVEIGEGLPCFLVAEIGLNHNGSLELAHKLIESASINGASMVKFQKRSPSDLATAEFLDAPFLKCPLFGKNQREVRNKLEFSTNQLKELKDHSTELGMAFSMSVFDLPSLEIAIELNLPVIKVASHSITNSILLKAIADTKLPVIASTGGTTWEEKDYAVEILNANPLVLLHCISAYPCPDYLVKLDTITELRKKYNTVVGYSGHEEGIDISVASVVLGASVIERHYTLNRSMVGLDHQLSLEPDEFAQMSSRIRRIQKARGISSGITPEELPSRNNYHVAICTKHRIEKGNILTYSDIVCKQPLDDEKLYFSGLEIDKVIGKSINQSIEADKPISRKIIDN